jgi:Na+-translocating ferredoxin:NAD+ oxidoreductase RnfD subunit
MKEGGFPFWFRAILILTAVMQTVFAFTLLANPAAINDVWPWKLTAISARILGASTLVSVPLGGLTVLLNRWSVARIPIVMLLTYRVFQLVAGVIHLNRFNFSRPPTWNYFFGGGLMLVILGYHLLSGPNPKRPPGRLPAWMRDDRALVLTPASLTVLRLVSAVFLALGIVFLILGPRAAPLWFEAPGKLTPLTARLFSSPMIGLALGLWLISRARLWREVAVPATGLTTFGLAATAAMLLTRSEIAPQTLAGYLIVITPLVLLILGLYLLSPARSRG